jgi:hypothetical protein
MPAGQQIPQDAASPPNGHSSLHDLFALTDEQILEIEPETQDAQASSEQLATSAQESPRAAPASLPASSSATAQNENRRLEASATSSAPNSATTEPPPWLAAQMKDPWAGEEARELWNGVQQAKSEAAAYRAAFANPEDARALKELYPGGVTEARASAERARVLDDIDRSYFGVAGKSVQEVSASRAQLAQTMLRENPAAFREMVFAGLRALEESGKGTGENTVDQAFRPEDSPSRAGPVAADRKNLTPEGVSYSDKQGASSARPQSVGTTLQSSAGEHDARVAAYASFEKSANEDLERSVGGAIERTLAQALPNASRVSNASGIGVPAAAGSSLQSRLSQAIRQDVEAALKGDRQLGEQVAQILSGRRLDEETRGQVVRLIGERAQQLVPVAAKRVLNDWTQTALTAHRSKNARADAASARRELAPTSPESRSAPLAVGSSPSSGRDRSQDPNRNAPRHDARRVDYRKLSDEQILEL